MLSIFFIAIVVTVKTVAEYPAVPVLASAPIISFALGNICSFLRLAYLNNLDIVAALLQPTSFAFCQSYPFHNALSQEAFCDRLRSYHSLYRKSYKAYLEQTVAVLV
jgi:hypothetical protein